jgi:hypothetical protein
MSGQFEVVTEHVMSFNSLLPVDCGRDVRGELLSADRTLLASVVSLLVLDRNFMESSSADKLFKPRRM